MHIISTRIQTREIRQQFMRENLVSNSLNVVTGMGNKRGYTGFMVGYAGLEKGQPEFSRCTLNSIIGALLG